MRKKRGKTRNVVAVDEDKKNPPRGGMTGLVDGPIDSPRNCGQGRRRRRKKKKAWEAWESRGCLITELSTEFIGAAFFRSLLSRGHLWDAEVRT